MKTLHWLTYLLMFIGALNWGLIGFFNVDLVAALFGVNTTATTVVYALIGISALINLILGFSVIRCDINRYGTLNNPL